MSNLVLGLAIFSASVSIINFLLFAFHFHNASKRLLLLEMEITGVKHKVEVVEKMRAYKSDHKRLWTHFFKFKKAYDQRNR